MTHQTYSQLNTALADNTSGAITEGVLRNLNDSVMHNAIREISAETATISLNDTFIILDAGANNVDATLPPLAQALAVQHAYFFQCIDTDSDSNDATLLPNGSDEINGGSSYDVPEGVTVIIVPRAAGWHIFMVL